MTSLDRAAEKSAEPVEQPRLIMALIKHVVIDAAPCWVASGGECGAKFHCALPGWLGRWVSVTQPPSGFPRTSADGRGTDAPGGKHTELRAFITSCLV